ncbi:hypothetical protein, partial [Pseudoalteromonas undina]
LMIQWAGAMAVPDLRQFSSLDDLAPEAINNATANWCLARRAAQKLDPWQKLQFAMSIGEFNKVKALVTTQTLGKV